MLGVGWASFAGWSLIRLAGTSSGEWSGAHAAGIVPVLGPFAHVATMPGGISRNEFQGGAAIVSGLLQLTGLGLLLAGAVQEEEVPARKPTLRVQMAPTAGPEQLGVTLLGSF